MRMIKILLLVTGLLTAMSNILSAQETLIEELESFRPFLSKTFKGEMAESTPDKPVIDIAKWVDGHEATYVEAPDADLIFK